MGQTDLLTACQTSPLGQMWKSSILFQDLIVPRPMADLQLILHLSKYDSALQKRSRLNLVVVGAERHVQLPEVDAELELQAAELVGRAGGLQR